MKLLEIHLLQSFAPSLLNRDDTGSPKDCLFGGQRRARVSSQSWKKAMRDYARERELLSEEQLAVRSKRLHKKLKDKLAGEEGKGFEAEVADYVAEAVLALIGAFHVETDESNSEESEQPFSNRELKSEYLVFLGNDRIDAVAKTLKENEDTARKAAEAAKKYREDLRKDKYKGALDNKGNFKKAVIKEFGKDLTQQLEQALDGGKAVDLALFGRMLADLPEKNVDGATQVAHALSTHAVSREFDYYTAVDDLKPDDISGADMIGTIEFNSACYYRYGAVDLEKLWKNLGGKREDGKVTQKVDDDLFEAGLRALLRAFVESIPSGKQNSFAAQNPPSFGAFRVQADAQPRNLANAFEKPVQRSDEGFVQRSIKALDDEWQWVDATYGDGGKVILWSRHPDLEYLKTKEVVAGAQTAIEQAVSEAKALVAS